MAKNEEKHTETVVFRRHLKGGLGLFQGISSGEDGGKTCTTCKNTMSLDRFSKRGNSYKAQCKDCVNEYSRARRRSNLKVLIYEFNRREKRKRYMKMYNSLDRVKKIKLEYYRQKNNSRDGRKGNNNRQIH